MRIAPRISDETRRSGLGGQGRTGKRNVPSPPAGGEISQGNPTKWLRRDKEERGSGACPRRPQAAKSRGATQRSGCAATRKNGEAERAFAARRRRNLAGQPNKVVAPRQGRTGKRNVPSPSAGGEISRGNPTKWLRRDKEERRSGTCLRRPQAAKSRRATQQSGCAATRKNGEAERAFAACGRRNLAGQPNEVVAPRQGRTEEWMWRRRAFRAASERNESVLTP